MLQQNNRNSQNCKESDNMECPYCNKTYDDEFKFCPTMMRTRNKT